jgi:hypothetical protein
LPDDPHFHCIALGLREDPQGTICHEELENFYGFDPQLFSHGKRTAGVKAIAPYQNET